MTTQGSLFDRAPVRDEDLFDSIGPGDRFSPDRVFRYLVWRVWDLRLPLAVFLGQNPSTATRDKTDTTFSKCIGFADHWGAGGVVMANPYAFVETHLGALVAAITAGRDIVGPENDRYLRIALTRADYVVVATGGNTILRSEARVAHVLGMVPQATPMYCLGRTKDGHPKHPCRLAYATPREPFTPDREHPPTPPEGVVP